MTHSPQGEGERDTGHDMAASYTAGHSDALGHSCLHGGSDPRDRRVESPIAWVHSYLIDIGGAMQRPVLLPLSADDVLHGRAAFGAWILDDRGDLIRIDSAEAYSYSVPAATGCQEISVGADGTVWLLPSGPGSVLRGSIAGGFEIVPVPAPMRKIAGGPDGTLWAVTTEGEVLSLDADGATCHHSPRGVDFAAEISVGMAGDVWIVSSTPRYGGRIVRRLLGRPDTWFDLPAPASATKLAVSPDGMAWTVNAIGAVWRLHPEGGGSLAECQVDTACAKCRFSVSDARVREISVGPDGTVWALAAADGAETALMWLESPAERRYRVVPTPRPAARVAAGVQVRP
jgi:streptogramin lyase